MSTYVVECYWPGVDGRQLTRAVERLAHMPREQGGPGLVSAILIPEDEIVLCIATGRRPAAVRASSQRAGLPAERVVPCELIRPRNDTSSEET